MRFNVLNTILLAACAICGSYRAEAQQVFRTQFATYDIREDAEALKRTKVTQHAEFAPTRLSDGSYAQIFDMPYLWSDGNVYIHLENVHSAYTLAINGAVAAEVEDSFSPSEIEISRYMRQGINEISLYLRDSAHVELEQGLEHPQGELFEGSYLHSQRRTKIKDFTVELVPDSTRKFGVLNIDMVVENSYNYDESIEVGYDIYNPDGKLLDYSSQSKSISGKSTDTVKFNPYIYHTYKYKWTPKSPKLYRVMLYVKRNGTPQEYIPLKLGFTKSQFEDGELSILDEQPTLKRVKYNAADSKSATQSDLKRLKREGYNTIETSYPQSEWFYTLCNEVGFYVIDQANINAANASKLRSVGGTPSNDPALLDEYLTRVKNMYYNSRNFSCVIGFSLGRDSGNGYNMYKAYEWLKSVEDSRPVIYSDAQGEWNSDMN